MTERAYELIVGICYPNLVPGDNVTKVIQCTDDERKKRGKAYNDPAVRLSEADVMRFNRMRGKPICIEHDRSNQVGVITDTWKDTKGMLRMTAKIFVDTPEGRSIHQRVKNGNLRGLSVGYGMDITPGGVVNQKRFHEISLVERPFFKGSYVTVTASNRKNYTSNSSHDWYTELYFDIMASNDEKLPAATPTPTTTSPSTNTGATTPVPTKPVETSTTSAAAQAIPDLTGKPVPPEKEASEITRRHEELLQEAENQRKKNESAQAELEELRKFKAQIDTQYAKDQLAKLQEYLKLQEEQLKAIKGEDAQLPKEVTETFRDIYLQRENRPFMETVNASAVAYKNLDQKYREEVEKRTALEERLTKLEQQASSLLQDQSIAQAHVNASRRRILGVPETEDKLAAAQQIVEVNASASGAGAGASGAGRSTLRNIVPAASNLEKRLMQMDESISGGFNPWSSTFSVNASGALEEMETTTTTTTRTFTPAPEHKYMQHVPNSMRYRAPNIFAHVVRANLDELKVPLEHEFERVQ